MLISNRIKRLGLLFALTMTLATGVVATVHAQDETETPVVDATTAAPTEVPEATPEVTPEPPPVDNPGDALPPNTETPQDIISLIWAALIAGAATISGSVFVTAVVNLEKVILPSVPGQTLKNVTSVVVWIIYALAIRFGFGSQVQGLAAFIVPILTTATPLVGVLIGSSKLYKSAVETKTFIWGFQRTAP